MVEGVGEARKENSESLRLWSDGARDATQSNQTRSSSIVPRFRVCESMKQEGGRSSNRGVFIALHPWNACEGLAH